MTLILLRRNTRTSPKPKHEIATHPSILSDLSAESDAILLVSKGGHIAYMNAKAGDWFKLSDGKPNIERLGRLTLPSNEFLNLCAAEGRARFSLSGHPVEGVSYAIPYEDGHALLVALRHPDLVVDFSRDQTYSEQALTIDHAFNTFLESNQKIAANLELETSLLAILENVLKLAPADYAEINVWDATDLRLTSYRYAGTSADSLIIETKADVSVEENSYFTLLSTHQRPILIADRQSYHQNNPAIVPKSYPYQSYVGVPMINGKEFVGTIELASLDTESFNDRQVRLLGIIADQAASAVCNALIYGDEKRKHDEASSLVKLAQAVNSLRDPDDLYKQLVDSIVPLIDAEVLGFIIYDENQRVLEAKLPFIGYQPTMLAWARFPILPGSEAEEVWIAQQTLICDEAPTDPRLHALGIDNLAITAGVQRAILAPLSSGGRMLGYLLVGDKRDGLAFAAKDIQMLNNIVAQATPIIENAILIQQSYRRAQRAEALRRVASLTGSNATLDEILKFSLQDLARLTQADHGAIFLLDEHLSELRLHKESLFGISSEIAVRLGRLPSDDPQYRETITKKQQAYCNGIANEDPDIPPVYQSLVKNLELKSLLIVPLVIRERGIGELILGSHEQHTFSDGDVQSVTTASGQLASAIEQAKLYTQTDESLRQRVDQLTALTRISRELNSSLDLNYLLQRVLEEALATTHANCGTILLFDLNAIRDNTDKASQPKIRLQFGDPHGADLQPLERVVLKRNKTIIVKDFEQTIDIRQARTDSLPPSHPMHPGIRSTMIVPIAYQEQVAGMIHLHARLPQRFDETARYIAETLAIQAAIAIGNAHRYQEQVNRGEQFKRSADTLLKVSQITHMMQVNQPLEIALEKLIRVIREATPFDSVLLSIYEDETEAMRRLVGVGISEESMLELKAHTQSWNSIHKIFKPEFQLGAAYFIPYERMPFIPEEIHTVTLLPLAESPWENGSLKPSWHPEDMLLVPLTNAEGMPLGLISLDAPRDGLRPDRSTIESLVVFSDLAALLIQNYKRMHTPEFLEVAQSVQDNLPLLLHKEIEGSITSYGHDQRVLRIRAGMDIAETINRQGDRSSVLITLGSEILSLMEMDIALIAEKTAHGLKLVHTIGQLPKDVNIDALVGQRNPLSHSLNTGEHILVSQDALEDTWSGSPLLMNLDCEAFICIPIHEANGTKAAVLAISHTQLPALTDEDEQMFALLARLVGIILDNLSLLNETSQRLAEVNLLLDFSRQLGSPEPSLILQTLVESAQQILPQVEAAMVALWDAKQNALVVQAASGYSDKDRLVEITYQAGEALPGRVYASGEPLRLDEIDFAQQYDLSSENLLRYRDATDGKLPASCMLIPIKQATNIRPLGVLILDNYTSSGAFTKKDEAVILSLTQQTALNLENTRLYRASEQRASQLQTLTRVATTITSRLHPDDLVASLLEQLDAILRFDTGTLWLRQDDQVVVRAALGFDDSEERIGLSAAIEDSLLMKEMIQTGEPISIADIRKDERFPQLVEPERLSWLGIPLLSGKKVTGVFALEKTEAEYYRPEDIQIAVTFAGQAAVALENASLFQESLARAFELDQRSQRLEMLNRLSTTLSESLETTTILSSACLELYDAVKCSSVSGILFDGQKQPTLAACHPSTSMQLSATLPKAPLFEHLQDSLGIFYSEDARSEEALVPLASFMAEQDTQSLLVLPLVTGNDLHGVFFLHVNEPHHFNSDEVGLGRTIANQTAVAIQNARLFAETRSLTNDLEQRVTERTAELAREQQRAEILLRIITELSASLDLEQVLNRTLKVLNEIIDAEQISVLILREGATKLYHLASVGYAPIPHQENRATIFDPDQGLAGWVISRRQAALIPNVLEDERWVQIPGTPSEHRSAIGVPLMLGEEALGAMLFFHRKEAYFSSDQLGLVQAAANQVAIAVNNAELYRLIRDQAEDLGKLLREQQVEASRSRAILEAVADGVLVTDAERRITLFTASAERILDLDRSEILGKSLDDFVGLFGRAASSWMETIRTWSQDPSTYQFADIYEEQIALEDGRVVSVHLSPVSLRNQFLGTVSIFRDITHQVEVDRLKSEFVATVSHELRTPMTSIKGYVDVLLMGAAGSLSDQQSHFLEIVKNNTERLTVLVNDLLDISRIETGRISLILQPIDVVEAAGQAMERLDNLAHQEGKPMTLAVEPTSERVLVQADQELVAQILDNLLENAYAYTSEGGSIRLSVKPGNGHVQIDVKDSGIGIPKDLQGKVFERFYRGEHPFVLATSGTGLGLSIVQHLVEMQNGRIWLESSGVPGKGSTFSFTLPVYIPENKRAEMVESQVPG